jgi:hypothetical protein
VVLCPELLAQKAFNSFKVSLYDQKYKVILIMCALRCAPLRTVAPRCATVRRGRGRCAAQRNYTYSARACTTPFKCNLEMSGETGNEWGTGIRVLLISQIQYAPRCAALRRGKKGLVG